MPAHWLLPGGLYIKFLAALKNSTEESSVELLTTLSTLSVLILPLPRTFLNFKNNPLRELFYSFIR